MIPGFLRITHWLNEGAAFSLFADSASPNAVRWGLIAFSAIAAIAVLIALIRLGSHITLTTVALALVLGGALGNLHDRIVYGSVVDFIEVHIFGYHWPDFNVADSSIVVGACLLLLDSLLPRKSPEPVHHDRKPLSSLYASSHGNPDSVTFRSYRCAVQYPKMTEASSIRERTRLSDSTRSYVAETRRFARWADVQLSFNFRGLNEN